MTDLIQLVSAVTRQVAAVERDGQPAKVVQARRTYPADIDDVWDACTNPERLPRWFLPVSGDLRLGGRYQLEGNAGGVIQRCEEPSLLAVTWEYGGEVSWLEVRLAESPGGTTLELEHTAGVDSDRWIEFGPGAVGVGWDMTLLGLGLHLEGGAPVDPAAAQELMSSPEGIQALTFASEEWGRASVASGERPEVAQAAAARTTAAYTGVEHSSVQD
jgi:uncharacterized protein YndB with AHSA1/START domain